MTRLSAAVKTDEEKKEIKHTDLLIRHILSFCRKLSFSLIRRIISPVFVSGYGEPDGLFYKPRVIDLVG